jgi:alkanesulfonate monooxygenase SsuD/methylene tetrahydromethanopterin reductase-like flavin-dependent oxidoreductase (luciferase family)
VPAKVLDFDLRHPANLGASGPSTYAAALDIIGWADDHRFERVGFGEHHQSPDGYLPCPLVFAAAVGGRTKTIRARVSILLASLYEPIRLAEEIAVADLCLQGRLDVGLGVGYVKDDFEAFGADYENRGAHLEWLVPFLRQAWTGEPFEHRGTTVQVTPAPAQQPMKIHLGGATRAAIDRAARIADGFFPPGMRDPWEAYRKACIRHGRPDPGEWRPRGPIFLWVTTDDKDETWRRLAPHVHHQMESYAQWTKAGMGRVDGPYAPNDAYVIATPDEAVTLANDLGPNGELHLNPLLSGIDPAFAWRMLETVERHVFPNLEH